MMMYDDVLVCVFFRVELGMSDEQQQHHCHNLNYNIFQ